MEQGMKTSLIISGSLIIGVSLCFLLMEEIAAQATTVLGPRIIRRKILMLGFIGASILGVGLNG
jgi:hypothetical protein